MTFSAAEGLTQLQAAYEAAADDRTKRPVLWIMDFSAFNALKAEASPRSKHLQLDPAGEAAPKFLGVDVHMDDRYPTPALMDQQQATDYLDILVQRHDP